MRNKNALARAANRRLLMAHSPEFRLGLQYQQVTGDWFTYDRSPQARAEYQEAANDRRGIAEFVNRF